MEAVQPSSSRAGVMMESKLNDDFQGSGEPVARRSGGRKLGSLGGLEAVDDAVLGVAGFHLVEDPGVGFF